MTSRTFIRRFRLLIAASWAIPPVFGLSFLLFVVELFDVRELGLIMLTFPLPIYIVGAQVAADVYFRRFAGPIVDYLEHPDDPERERAALRRARRFPLDFWMVFLVYLICAPLFVMWSASLGYGFEPSGVDWFRIELVSLVVSIIVGLPIFLLTVDLFGRAFTRVELKKPHVPVTAKVFLLGALVPLLIDTMLVQYYWTETGYFTVTTFFVWLVLEILAVAGAVLAVRSFRQSLAPLDAVMEQDGEPDTIDISRLRPQSTDELGVLAAGYRVLLDRFLDQNMVLASRARLLRESQRAQTFDHMLEAIRDVVREAMGADELAIALSRDDELRIVLAGDRAVRREGHLVLPRGRAPLLFAALDDVEAAPAFHDLAEVAPDTELATELGCRSVLVSALRAENETIGAIVAIYHDSRTAVPPRETAVFADLAMEAATLISSSLSRERHREAESRYQQLTQFAPDAILLLDEQLVIVSTNDAARSIFGPDAIEKGRGLATFVDAEGPRVALEAQLKRALDGELVTLETRLTGADETSVPVEIRAKRLPTENVCVMALVRDTSERKELEGQLLHAQKMEVVGRLAGGMAHDFNNLLTAVIGSASLLEMDLEGEQEAEAQNIVETAERAATLTRQLLAFSRHQVVTPTVIDLSDTVRSVKRILERLVPSSIELTIELEDEPFRVRVDRGQIEQVLMNLVVNARDAVADDGRLSVSVENVRYESDGRVPAGDWAVLRVTDDGDGIPEPLLERIFEPYFTTKDSGRGTGLGLATVYGIVSQAGGHVVVDSEEGEGTSFAVYLPRTLQAEAPRPSKRPATVTRFPSRALLVEDDEMLRKVMTRSLTRAGVTVVAAAARGDEAVELAKDESLEIDLLVSDVVLPGLKGPEVARRVTELRPSIRVLLVSGYAETDTIEEIIRSGIPFLAKPFTPAELLAKLREISDVFDEAPPDAGA